jgi:hypothetical protein
MILAKNYASEAPRGLPEGASLLGSAKTNIKCVSI